MPKVNRSQMTGDFGESYVRTVVETGWHCLFMSPGNRDRYGIDGTVIDVVNGKVQPLQFNVQVKAGLFKNRRGVDEFRAPVDAEDVALWKESYVPVVLVCVDTKSPTTAYWRIIRPGDKLPIYVSRRRGFGPGSRDAVVGAIRKALNQARVTTLQGKMLNVPLNSGIRKAAKACYRRLKSESHSHPTFGSIIFTWKGWRHITRKKRSTRKIAMSILLLPCVLEILQSMMQPTYSRELEPR